MHQNANRITSSHKPPLSDLLPTSPPHQTTIFVATFLFFPYYYIPHLKRVREMFVITILWQSLKLCQS